ncbi:MAG TPA: imidazole glycerol phosphate synthase subunit HisH [Planctomycetota bacterium]
MGPAILDYGMGNLRSVANACEALGSPARVARRPEELRDADRIILPGVGAFGDAMANLRSGGWIAALEEEVRGRGKPFLGLCLGMQLLATTGTEFGRHAGLGWIPGVAERLEPADASLRVPHMGWNRVLAEKRDGLLAGVGEGADFYFVHSYVLRPDDPSVVTGRCVYGAAFAAVVERGNIQATQFHPEKSQKAGLTVLGNFLRRQAC